MKKGVLIASCALAVALSTPFSMIAEEKEPEKVIVTLNDGTTITGYEKNDVGSGLKRLFGASGSIQSFVKVSPEKDGKNAKTYNAKDILGYKYANDTTIQYETSEYNSPVPFKLDKKTKGLFRVEKRLPNGTIYSYLTYISTGYRNQTSKLVTTYGVKLRGDDRIFNIIVNGRIATYDFLHLLSKKGPKDLAEKYEEYFKDDGHCKELVDDPTLFVRIYDDYLKTNPAISRTEKK